jgi:NAD-dependent histone deacetylase SIR2
MSSKRSLGGQDDSQPAKKRKMSQPKPRITEHLHLETAKLKESEKEQLEKLLKVIYKKRKIVVVAGAGISVSAGSKSLKLLYQVCQY